MNTHGRPEVSVVIATYNRSRALSCAIRSVMAQTFSNWELLVIGDRCTDDTEETVRLAADPRIRFLNLERNHGEQSAPNNVGLSEARGKLIAYLNHDDVWLPNHLQACRQEMQARQSDLVFASAIHIGPASPLPLRMETMHAGLAAIPVRGAYSPAALEAGDVPASCWLARRTMLRRLRGWRASRECHVHPSQDLLYRAWRAGYRIHGLSDVTLVIVQSGARPGSYTRNDAQEQEWVLERLHDPLLPAALAALAPESNSNAARRMRRRPAWWLRLLALPLAHVGINPRELEYRYANGFRRGELIARLREIRGLPDVRGPVDGGSAVRFEVARRSCHARIGETVGFAAGEAGVKHLAYGWSRPEPPGVWNDGPEAALMFDFREPPGGDLGLDFELHPFNGQTGAARCVEIHVGSQGMIDTWTLRPGESSRRRLIVPGTSGSASTLLIRFRFRNPASPRNLGISGDPREMAMQLVRLHIERVKESSPAG